MNKAEEAKIQRVIAELWKKNLPTLRERLDLLDQTAAAAASGKLSEAARAEALNIAHKLAGSLGMFGYQEGTDLARQMELIFRSSDAKSLAKLPSLTRELRKSLHAGLSVAPPS